METRGREGARQVNSQDRGIPGRGNSECKGPVVERGLSVLGNEGPGGGETGFEL